MRHSDAQFSHGLCPDCTREYFPEESSEAAAMPATNSASVSEHGHGEAPR
jgi:hypothetical protein